MGVLRPCREGWAAGLGQPREPADALVQRQALHWMPCNLITGAAMKRLSGWLSMIMLLTACAANAATPGVQLRSTKGEFADVRDRVVSALENRGLVINYTAKVGDMLERTGRDLGRDRRIYGNAEVLEFCSAALSRDTMEADPRNIVFCPYAIAVYTLPKVPGTVYLSYRVPAAQGSGQSIRALRAVEKLLADVVGEALK